MTVLGNEVGVDAGFFGVDVSDSRLAGNGVAFRSSAYLGAGALERNSFVDNGTGVELTGTTASLVNNVFSGNDVAFTSSEPVEDSTSRLVGNRFVRNGDAIVITEPGTELQGNLAENNRGWGIYAPGAVDLGGNRARGNGNEPRCVGVVCGAWPRS